MSEKLITVEEACERLSISRYKVTRLIAEGHLTSVKLGRRDQSPVRIHESSLERLISEGVSDPAPVPEPVPEYRPKSW